MNCYIYCADIYCEACGECIRESLAEEAPANPGDWRSYDSEDYPKGPCLVGESDSPLHCGSGPDCLEPTIIGKRLYGKFLENALTGDGKHEVRSANGDIGCFWRKHYDLEWWNEFDRQNWI